MTDRYVTIYDEDDFILDNETDEYLTLEEACNKLNDYEDNMAVIADFFSDVAHRLNEAEAGEGE